MESYDESQEYPEQNYDWLDVPYEHDRIGDEYSEPAGSNSAYSDIIPTEYSAHAIEPSDIVPSPADRGPNTPLRTKKEYAIVAAKLTAIITATSLIGGVANAGVTLHYRNGEVKGEVEELYRGQDDEGNDTDAGCLDSTPYSKTKLDIDDLRDPVALRVKVPASDKTLPSLQFMLDDNGHITPAEDYTNTYIRLQGCDDAQ